ncbi:YwqG family protein [Deinococcus sp. YIM 134068]|uniref:YwqG family protein n=1 Tax=Deinococcus lichenicola TaxID=3118910 RepID=UPI002F93831A
MQPHLLEALRLRIEQAGVSAHETRLLPHARLAFDLHLNGESDAEVGESRWGGGPDVPEGFEWPRLGRFPMGFVAQINLADLVPDEENPFPQRGLLQFFADMTSDAAHVVLVDADAPLRRADPELDTEWGEMPPHRLRIVPRADLPQWATGDYDEVTADMSEEEQQAYGDAFNVTEGARPGADFAGQLLGHVAGIGHDPRESAFELRELGPSDSFDSDDSEHQSAIQRWRNLATFDSIRSLDFLLGDAGYFGFLIHEDDLERLDFSRVYALLQSS